MSDPPSSEEQRARLDLLLDEASMLSFPASDPPAVFVEEPRARRRNDADTRGNDIAPAVSGAGSDTTHALR